MLLVHPVARGSADPHCLMKRGKEGLLWHLPPHFHLKGGRERGHGHHRLHHQEAQGSEIGLRYNEGGTRVQPKQQQVVGNLTLETKYVQRSAKRCVRGCEKLVPALAYLFCLGPAYQDLHAF